MRFAVRINGDSADIINEEGGYAFVYFNTEIFVTNYYQDRMSRVPAYDMSDEDDDIHNDETEGSKIYYYDWPEHTENISMEMIRDAVEWLAPTDNEVRFVNYDELARELNNRPYTESI